MATAIRDNSMPGAGMTATQPAQPVGQTVPTDVQALVEQLTPIQQRFRAQSTFIRVAQPQQSFTALGQQLQAQVSNVGLAVRVWTEWNVTITVANGATSAETFNVSPNFPYNLILNTSLLINGGAASYSAGGIATLARMLRKRRGSGRQQFIGVMSSAPAGSWGPALDYSLLRVALGSNLTGTNNNTTQPYLSGIKSVSVAGSASTNNTITMTFITCEWLVLDIDSLVGALPLQNNATFTSLSRQIQGALNVATANRDDLNAPFYGAGADLTFTLTACTADYLYEFASVPQDPSLYQGLIANSYQVQEVQKFTVATTGVEAFSYNIPQNQFAVALHILARDGNGAVVPGYGQLLTNGLSPTVGLNDLKIVYNAASVRPILQKPNRERAAQFLTYDYDPFILPGHRLWDGEDSSDDINAADQMSWLDCYSTATPQLLIDVGSGVTTSLVSNIAREAVIAGAVQQVG